MQYPKEATMETLFLIVGIAAVVLLLARPQGQQPQIIYVPVEVAGERGGVGCMPLLLVGVLALVVVLVLGG
jgi:hypothetical protein